MSKHQYFQKTLFQSIFKCNIVIVRLSKLKHYKLSTSLNVKQAYFTFERFYDKNKILKQEKMKSVNQEKKEVII
jgi:hypothetical protein